MVLVNSYIEILVISVPKTFFTASSSKPAIWKPSGRMPITPMVASRR